LDRAGDCAAGDTAAVQVDQLHAAAAGADDIHRGRAARAVGAAAQIAALVWLSEVARSPAAGADAAGMLSLCCSSVVTESRQATVPGEMVGQTRRCAGRHEENIGQSADPAKIEA
jgi:hypothetical protein